MSLSPWHDFVEQFVKPGTLVFDIGAHGGNYTINYLLMGARVIAVEPQANIIEILINKVLADKRIDFSMLTPICAACGDAPGVLQMTVYKRCGLASLAPEKWSTSRMRTHLRDEIVNVNVTTLDNLIGAYGVPDFLKVDVEYYEPEVFAGLTKPVPALCYEYTREQLDDSISVARHLQEIGNYEFAYGFERDAPSVDWCNDIDAVFGELSKCGGVGLWGDMYARLA